MPCAIAAAARALQGAITMPSVRYEPLEMRAAWLCSPYTWSARTLRTLRRPLSSSTLRQAQAQATR